MLVLELVGNFVSLLYASIVQRNVVLAMHDAVFIPIRLAVPDKNIFILRHLIHLFVRLDGQIHFRLLACNQQLQGRFAP